MVQINLLAVLVAALSTFVLGGLWYSKLLFGPAWQRAESDNRDPKQGHPAKVFGLSFGFALIAAFVYAILMTAPTSASGALLQGALTGAGLVAASFGINYQFANRKGVLWLIDAGYHTLQFALYGLIIGLWRAPTSG
jgi:hypothetical protein